MKRPRYVILLILACTAIGVVVFFPTEKKRVWKTISASVEAIMHEDIEALMENVSYNYNDNHGGSYLTVKRRMQAVFNRLDNIDIEEHLVSITIHEGRAESEVKFKVTATEGDDRGYVIGDAVSWQKMKLFLEKSPYEWEVVRIERLRDNGS